MLIQKQYKKNNFTGNISGNNNNRLIFLIIEEVKGTALDFSHRTVKVL